MIEMILTDDTGSVTLQFPEKPLSEEPNNNDVEVTTLNNDVSVYMYPNSDKNVVSHTWAFMEKSVFDTLKGFRDRQRTLYKFPLLTITERDITDMPVYMKLGARNTIDDCGNVQGVSIVLRESGQLPDIGS